MTTEIQFRPTNEEDRAFLYRVYASTRSEELQQLDWTDQAKHDFLALQFKAQHRFYQQNFPEAEFQVILRGNDPIGRLYVDHRSNEIRLIDITLLPEFQRRGIGSALLESLLAEARASQLPLRMHVEKFNPAMRLYERLGFRKIEDHGVYFLLEGASDESCSNRDNSRQT